MKRVIALATFTIFGLMFGFYASTSISSTSISSTSAEAPGQQKPPEVLQLATDSKLGPVTFNHLNHITKNYNLEGTGPVVCIECHHTAQPASEVAKLPPLKTAWPPDRTTTLTADLIEKDPKAAEVIACRSCHSKTGTTPKLLPAIPQIKYEGGTALITLNNQQAFHRNCASCHDEVVKNRKDAKAPATQKCTACHKK